MLKIRGTQVRAGSTEEQKLTRSLNNIHSSLPDVQFLLLKEKVHVFNKSGFSSAICKHVGLMHHHSSKNGCCQGNKNPQTLARVC